MNRLLIAIASGLVACAGVGCRTAGNLASRPNANASIKTNSTNAALETELQAIINRAESANAEADRILETNTNESLSSDQLEKMRSDIQDREKAVQQDFLRFIHAHPNYGGGYAGYGDFLLGHYDELGARDQLERALEFDRANPTVYNDLANIYGHRGDVKEAFNYYAKAIQLDPNEPVYYQNFATTVFLFRPDAREYYNINEQQVFDKAMVLYSNAMRLDPTNYALAVDVAKSYYGIKPWRFEDAMRSWTNALNLARSEIDRQEIYTHFARIQIQAGNFGRAREFLDQVTEPQFAALKNRMLKTIRTKESTGA